ncbi:unnamed protein product [Ilex paraguariensis]|uniref:Uncharacterized protein n=1 Tax=Ilex paraguariensis TaxID=185542 RepID=A0ABC8U9J1_9AQUA
MASPLSIYFSPYSLARPSNNQTRNRQNKAIPPRNLRKNPNYEHKTRTTSRNLPLSSTSGGEATTFTRLPPKDDFVDSPFDSTFQSPAEVKLSDSTITQTPNKNVSKAKNELENDRLRSEDEEIDGKLAFDYGNFELFEINSDSDYGSDDDLGDEHNNDEILGFMDEEFENKGFEEEEEEDKEKQKGVPAVMRCFDRAKIYVKAGDGGNGVVAFRREKYVPLGGPSGGDGGRGGNVYVEVDESMNSLLPFRQSVHFRAGRGAHGQGRKQNGAKGEDVVVKVPPGTVIREAGKDGVEGNELLELLHPGQRALLLPGGRGGRGNASFKSGTNKVPKIAENGEEEHYLNLNKSKILDILAWAYFEWLELELKLVADVGIIGAPNAGKSTFLSVVSAAQPTIANYPFTTLLPNLGVVSFDYDATMVVADLPGLLEGAHRGFGLGHEFLRHTERCSVLQPEYEFDAVRLELEMFNPDLADKPYLVAYNKMDLPEAYENWVSFKERLHIRGIEPFCMSAVKREGRRK